MAAILSKVKKGNLKPDYVNPIIMVFEDKDNEGVEYYYRTTVESQLGIKPGSINNRESLINLIGDIENNIGKEHDINLYDITFSEMTKGIYVSYKNTSYLNSNPDRTVSVFHTASYKTREDAIFDQISKICMMSIQGDIVGVKTDGVEEEISDPKKLFFGESKILSNSEKYPITDSMLKSLTTEFILEKANLDMIGSGYVLVKEEDFSDCRNVHVLTREIEKYRIKKNEIERINNSVKKLIFFWEKPEPMPVFEISNKESLMLKQAYLYQKNYEYDCFKANKKALEKIVLKYNENFNDSDDFRKFLIDESKQRLQKYKGQNLSRIKVV